MIDHESSGHTVWWNGSAWAWKAWKDGAGGQGIDVDALSSRLRAWEWLGLQGRDSQEKVLADVAALRERYSHFYRP